MEKHITIGKVNLPLQDFVVSRNAILGITKSGKTYLAKGIAEQLLDDSIPIIVFDAIGVWQYLKTPGKGKGYKIVVAGGENPDLPLTPQSAPAIVRAAITENIPLIIDLYDSKLSKADWRRIVQESFRILLYENKGLRHIFLEEAAEYAPQKVMDCQTYAEVEKLARMGGNRSLGITFINQRAQELNKAVLELCDNIVLLRQRGTHAIDSLEKQMDKLSPDTAKEIALTLPNMTQGDCWVFTENMEAPIRTRSKEISSYHPDRRTPDHKSFTKSVSTTDFVNAMSGKLDSIIAETKANDPAELKKQLAAARKEISVLQQSKPAEKATVKEVPALTDHERTRLTKLIEMFEGFNSTVNSANTLIGTLMIYKDQSSEEMVFFRNLLAGKLTVPQASRLMVKPVAIPARRLPVAPRSAPPSSNGDVSIGKCERAILTALAQYPQGRTSVQVAVLTGYSVKSGGFNNSLGKLRSSDLITRSQPMKITEVGLSTLGEYTLLPTGKELAQHWIGQLGKCEAMILSALVDAYPKQLTSEQVAEITGYSRQSGGFNNSLGKLRTLELITHGQPMSASQEFFQ